MKIKTYTGFLNGEELREVYRDNYYSIHKSYGDFIYYEVIRHSPKFDWVGTTRNFGDALKLTGLIKMYGPEEPSKLYFRSASENNIQQKSF